MDMNINGANGWSGSVVKKYLLCLHLARVCVSPGKLSEAFQYCQVLNERRQFTDCIPWQSCALEMAEVCLHCGSFLHCWMQTVNSCLQDNIRADKLDWYIRISHLHVLNLRAGIRFFLLLANTIHAWQMYAATTIKSGQSLLKRQSSQLQGRRHRGGHGRPTF